MIELEVVEEVLIAKLHTLEEFMLVNGFYKRLNHSIVQMNLSNENEIEFLSILKLSPF